MSHKTSTQSLIRDFSSRLQTPSKRALVIASDNVNIWGVVVALKGRHLSLLAKAFQPLLGEQHAFQTLLDTLRVQLKLNKAGLLPKNAHLTCTDAMSMLVDMPAENSQQQDHETLRDLFRWELEPAIAQRQSLWTLGNVLIAHQWLKRSQLHHLIEVQAQRRFNHGEAPPLGNMILDEGYIAEPQLDSALSFQQCMREESTELDCAWIETPAPNSFQEVFELADQPENPEESRESRHWLACAISTSRREYWRREFLQAGITLESIHPLYGASPSISGADDAVLLDLHNGAVCCSRYIQGVLTNLRLDHGFDHESLTQCQSLLEGMNLSENTLVEIRGSLGDIADCGAALANQLRLSLAISRCDVIEADDLDYIEHARYSSLAALAGQQLKQRGATTTLSISTVKPGIPLQHRIGFWWSAAAALTACFLMSMEFYYGLQLHNVAVRYERTKAELEQKEKTAELLETAISSEHSLKETETKLQKELNSLKQKYMLLNNHIPQRQTFITQLLPMLGQATPQELVLDRVSESTEGLRVTGWAMDDVTAQKLVSALSGPLSDYQLQLSDTQIIPQNGPFGHDGQQFLFNIVARPTTEDGPQ